MNIHVVTGARLSASALYDFCTFHTKFIQHHRRRSCDVTIMNIHISIQPSTNATNRYHREHKLNNAVQCWNEWGCKRDENALFLPFFENLDRRQLERGFETYY